MNKKRNIMAILIAFMSLWTICHAQQTQMVAFNYDMDGNRIVREILFVRMDEVPRNDDTSERDLSSTTEFFDTMMVSLYPNPTSDKFFVKTNGETNERAEIMLTHITGAVIEKRVLTNTLELFDLSGVASGVYLFKLTLDDETRIWKVFKI